MDVQLRQQGHWVIVRVDGRIDSFNYEHLTGKLQTLTRMGKKHLALDLTKAAFLSLPTIRFLSSHAKQVADQGGQLAFINPVEKVQDHMRLFPSSKNIRICSEADLNKTEPEC